MSAPVSYNPGGVVYVQNTQPAMTGIQIQSVPSQQYQPQSYPYPQQNQPQMVPSQQYQSQPYPKSQPNQPQLVPVISTTIDPPQEDVELQIQNDNQSGHIARKQTVDIESSVFSKNEEKWAKAWIFYTALYWTLITWIPILIFQSFTVNLVGLIFWCVGAVLFISSAYFIWKGYYPSGATKDDPLATYGVGRIVASLLTGLIIIDCYALSYVSLDLNTDNNGFSIYDVNFIRLIFHLIHIFWTSLFFYNKFRQRNKEMANYAFITEWIDIILLCVVSYVVLKPKSVDLVYFSIIGIKLIGWMFPMMFLKKWGGKKHSKTVSVHLLLLDLCTDIPVIGVVLASGGYKDGGNNIILWVDIIWKSFVLARSISIYLIKYQIYDYKHSNPDNNDADNNNPIPLKTRIAQSLSYLWLLFVFLYWSILVWVRCGLDNEITLNYEYYLWFMGLIGVFGAFDYISDILQQEFKSSIAWISLFMACDIIVHIYVLLNNGDSDNGAISITVIVFHCVALITSVIFYSKIFQKGMKLTYAIQWIDIFLMIIVIEILHNNGYNKECFSFSLCVGYFVVFTIKIIGLYIPIILGYAKNEKHIHTHMIVLDSLTDLPLVIIIFVSHGYDVNAFLFVDIAIKFILLIYSYAYHLLINLILKRFVNTDAENEN